MWNVSNQIKNNRDCGRALQICLPILQHPDIHLLWCITVFPSATASLLPPTLLRFSLAGGHARGHQRDDAQARHLQGQGVGRAGSTRPSGLHAGRQVQPHSEDCAIVVAGTLWAPRQASL